MAKYKKWEVKEVNCPEGLVKLQVRADIVGTLANLLQGCSNESPQASAVHALGIELADAGDLIYKQVDQEDLPEYSDLADNVVMHEVENVENRRAG